MVLEVHFGHWVTHVTAFVPNLENRLGKLVCEGWPSIVQLDLCPSTDP